MKILIATPAYGSVVYSAYHDSVLRTVSFFAANFPGIAFESRILSLSMVTTARNLLASLVLNDESFTHLLFIDADMGFQPSLIARMLAFRKPVTGIVAPQRRLDYEAYHKARARTDQPALARVIGNEYVAGDGAVLVDRMSDGTSRIEVVDGFVRATHTGTGIMLIERGVLEQMRDAFPELWVAEPPEHVRRLGLAEGGLLQCFEPGRDKKGIALGEDVTFCLRWTQRLEGEIWANIDEPIMHVGQETHTGHFLTRLQHGPIRLDIVQRDAAPGDEPADA